MTYHKLLKKLKRLEKKFPEYAFMGINKKDVFTTEKGRLYIKNSIIKTPRIYKIARDVVDYNPLAKQIIEIIGE